MVFENVTPLDATCCISVINGRVCAKIGAVMTEQRDGQKECRRTLGVDAVRVLGDNIASEVTRKDIVALIMEIVDRGANVQAGSVLRELSAS